MIRVPLEQHPYPEVENSIRRKCPTLALVFNTRLGVWIVVQEVDRYVYTTPMLKGIPGVDGKWCNCVHVMNLWNAERKPLDPAAYGIRLLKALEQMSTAKCGGIENYLDQMYERNEELKERDLLRAHADSMDVAKDVIRGAGRIISTNAGTSNVDKVYANTRPELDEEGKKIMVDIS